VKPVDVDQLRECIETIVRDEGVDIATVRR
jgi:hypothetical protein